MGRRREVVAVVVVLLQKKRKEKVGKANPLLFESGKEMKKRKKSTERKERPK